MTDTWPSGTTDPGTWLAQLRTQREALVRSMGSGTLSVSAGGVSRTYRSIGELQQALAAINAQLVAAGGGGAQKVRKIRINAARRW